ncbi:MAG: hypothetical protein EA361_10730 [Bacteroidetes bacterium]|nr:MAG: hypothetical protein EA361_10730 [Bacteroidota bacterium]
MVRGLRFQLINTNVNTIVVLTASKKTGNCWLPFPDGLPFPEISRKCLPVFWFQAKSKAGI